MEVPFEALLDRPMRTEVALRGELDLSTVGHLRCTMIDASSSPALDVIIDARRLTFLGGCGLRALTNEVDTLRHGRRQVRTINLSEPAARLTHLLHAEGELGVTSD